MTRSALVRLTIVVPLTVAVLRSAPTQRVGAHMHSAGARSTSSVDAGAPLHPVGNGKIAFDTGGGEPRLEVINPDGTGQKQLTLPCLPDSHRVGCIVEGYAWSPNGTRLAFFQGYPDLNGPSTISLFIVNADGGGEKRLARCGQTEGCGWGYRSGISWSPDGSRIVFADRWSLYVVNANGGGLRRLTHCNVSFTHSASGAITGWAKKSCSDISPAWSPDGSRIAFARGGRAGSGLNVVNADGTGLKALARRLRSASDPVWSPDGRKIAFDTAGRADAIYTVNGDGSHLRLLVSGPPGSGPGLPSWSPDGTRILYASTPRDGGHFRLELWVMNANGTGRLRLYHSVCCTGGPGYPIWSPDGKYIAFDADINLHPQLRSSGIYLMDADGRHLHRLTQFSSVIAWQPIP